MLKNSEKTNEILPSIRQDPESGLITMNNGKLALSLKIRPGEMTGVLKDLSSGRHYADGPYVWMDLAEPEIVEQPIIQQHADGSCQVLVKVKIGRILVEQTFLMPAGEPDVLLETITLKNPGTTRLNTSQFSCGFSRTVMRNGGYLAGMSDVRLCEIPYRRNTETGELRDFSVGEIVSGQCWFSTMRNNLYNRRLSPAWGSEAWAIYSGDKSLLVSKYNPDAMEWSLAEGIETRAGDGGEILLRFGGAGIWKLGDPEGAAMLAPGAEFTFGETRYQVISGGWKAAFAEYRQYTESKGHVIRPGYNPLVHWNELYDNPYWWIRESPQGRQMDQDELREKYYKTENMILEVEKAREIGCGCFYMDPGWDTDFGSSIWDEKRLGKLSDFARLLKEKYGMSLALHTPLAPWSETSSYPRSAVKKDAAGQIQDTLCVISKQYQDLKLERLEKLCRDGVYFLMYDGSWYDTPCHDPAHGHAVPSTRQEHVDAILSLSQKLHATFPDVLIEQHDPITGPGTPRYTPTYFMHGKPGAFDDLWGFEFMVVSLDDIVSRRAFSLYYVNLAYSIPVYLHIDLRTDRETAVAFWWYASTCRHLGIGGKHPDEKVWEAHKKAMQLYNENKLFFTQGDFYGLDEETHAHTLPEAGQCVMNCFNLEDKPVSRTLTVRLADVGLDPSSMGETVSATFEIPAMGHRLLKISRGRIDIIL